MGIIRSIKKQLYDDAEPYERWAGLGVLGNLLMAFLYFFLGASGVSHAFVGLGIFYSIVLGVLCGFYARAHLTAAKSRTYLAVTNDAIDEIRLNCPRHTTDRERFGPARLEPCQLDTRWTRLPFQP